MALSLKDAPDIHHIYLAPLIQGIPFHLRLPVRRQLLNCIQKSSHAKHPTGID